MILIIANETREARKTCKNAVAELEKTNNDLKGQAARLTRKDSVSSSHGLLSKSSVEAGDKLDAGMLGQDAAALRLSSELR